MGSLEAKVEELTREVERLHVALDRVIDHELRKLTRIEVQPDPEPEGGGSIRG